MSHDNTPATNPVTNDGATLGRVLFYDRKLSANGTVSCSSCHIQEHGFSDPRPRSTGFDGGLTRRHSMGLSNARFYRAGRFFWDERAESLEKQVLMPFLDEVEMGLTEEKLVEIVAGQDYYPPLFKAAFGTSVINADRIANALAQFVRSLVSAGSRYDAGRRMVSRPMQDFPNFTVAENRGKRLFMTNSEGSRAPCTRCHQSEAFVGSARRRARSVDTGATNNGLDAVSVKDRGVAESTNDIADTGKFKVPSLRNIAVTAPYMHDGWFATLEDVIEFYSSGIQRHANLDPALRRWYGSPLLFEFTPDEKAALAAFLRTLTDEGFLAAEKFSDPFAIPDRTELTRVANRSGTYLD